jgi:menaquinone-9 beta-reductase
MSPAEAIIIGGGIAGGAMAAHLARAGRHVVLIERRAGAHDKVCGEFVSGEAALYLHDLDIDLESLGAVEISTVNFCTRSGMVAARLPFPAYSVSRRILDEAILQKALAYGAELRRGWGVRSLGHHNDIWVAETEDGNEFAVADAFLATGKHDLRGWKRPPGRQGDLVAFKMHWRLEPAQIAALHSVVELFLFPGGYAGLELVESGIANLCLVIRRRHLAGFAGNWDLLLAALRSDLRPLDERLGGAKPCWDRPLAIASVPYGFVQTRGDGPWRLGDQAAVIPSFAGGGIAIALHSARLASRFYLAGAGAARFQSQLACEVAAQIGRATLISQMLVHPAGQAVAGRIVQIMPNLVGYLARHTRIPRRRVNVVRQEIIATERPAARLGI